MKNLAEQQHHEIEVKWAGLRAITNLRNYADHRLYEWGKCIRAITQSNCPPLSPKTLDLSIDRVDFDRQYEIMELIKRFDGAEETDAWMQPLRETSPNAFKAAGIRYVWTILPEDQIFQFNKETGLKKTQYYWHLDRVVQHISAEILVKEKPELKHRSELQFVRIATSG